MVELSIRALRVNAGLRQEDVADRLGVNRSTVIKWESDKHELSSKTVHALAYLYGVSINNMRLPVVNACPLEKDDENV